MKRRAESHRRSQKRPPGALFWISALIVSGIAGTGAYTVQHWLAADHPTAIAHPAGFLPTNELQPSPPGAAPEGMAWIPGGEFSMGCADPTLCIDGGHESMADARPIHRVFVDPFWIDMSDVTNEQFARFVKATGYVTIAEQTPKAEDFPSARPENLVAGSTVFTPTERPVPLTNLLEWWRYEPGADWRHPEGPQSNIQGREKYPVVQVAYADAAAYAKWVDKRLPTEAEWEFAARGGLAGNVYVWGDDFHPNGKFMANTFQGQFPVKDKDSGEDGFAGIAPVAQFPPNGYGLYDMSGNVWQWCSDWYSYQYYATSAAGSAVARNPTGPDAPIDPAQPNQRLRVHRGGSFLCTDQYCTRYMVGTRGKGDENTASNHLGFRCVQSPAKTDKNH